MEPFIDTLVPSLQPKYSNAISLVSDQSDGTAFMVEEVMRAHFSVVDYFLREGEGEGIGGIGPKEPAMLLSALSRPHVSYGGIEKWSTVHEKAATLLYGLIMNHPFYDANKRTAYLSTIHYLYVNGFILSVSPTDLENLTVLIAERGLKKYRRFKDLQKSEYDPEVRFISWYLRENTHRLDKRQYLITYRELEKVLKKYDVVMENPSNNSIDISRWEKVEVKKKHPFQKQQYHTEMRRVCSLGFPGWSKQVGKGRLKHVRTELKLTPEHGVDSQSFFNGLDDMRVLIDLYEGALRRLAYR
ncbi:type II toxin-antitoxin system death-on-curing family toxin [uncultured Sulfitobacter sp.]|uniref:type II toxin-antitoxin system death-on-curing family toxin n=1 Tax=uncultured Sulfitobacter sp. TaxID=191468 RepID=UPI002624EA7C|nr:type II toxin-antitoxin system death-on-curing family toxin [uncultured Sulfitobacter sp.]